MIISDNDNYVELSCCITVLALAALCLALFTISVVEHLLTHSTPSNWPSQRGRPWLPSANVTRPRPLTVPSWNWPWRDREILKLCRIIRFTLGPLRWRIWSRIRMYMQFDHWVWTLSLQYFNIIKIHSATVLTFNFHFGSIPPLPGPMYSGDGH